MCTLAHIFEAAGLATVGIGSIREQMGELGTSARSGLRLPVGATTRQARRCRVPAPGACPGVRNAQAYRTRGVEEFPEPVIDEGTEMLVCPLPPRHDPNAHPASDEARGLRAAYDRAIQQYGNRVGAGRVTDADNIPAAIEAFVRIAEGDAVEAGSYTRHPGPSGSRHPGVL